jgi:UDP-3-O-[3-hydroxymyristoyl] N-acetylglucosamine deacetylase/3-hydroxyacyl-[acyl-carrier-protein] dehydratase
MAQKQRTIQKAVTLNGKGLHTGAPTCMTMKPAPAYHGVIFQRVDLPEKPLIRALAEYVVDTSRGTTLEENGARIYTVEHVLAALTGFGIDNLLIELDGPETPILDGSARIFCEAIESVGTMEQESPREFFVVREKMVLRDPESQSEIIAFPDEEYNLQVNISFNSPILNNQFAILSQIGDFRREISECRTFVVLRELEFLQKNNLIKGGDLENAIVIVDREISQEELDRLADLFKKPRVSVKTQGILNNLDLHFNNEPARHKLLDVVGDLALAGMPIQGKIIATRPGHKINSEFAKLIRKSIRKDQNRISPPKVDVFGTPVMDILQIQKVLPHRPPFLLVDKVLELTQTSVTALKNVTMNEPFFVGHYPSQPIMPGVLLVEAMAQAGGILVLNTVPDPENYLAYFMKIDQVKFRKNVIPGDTLLFHLELLVPIKRGIAQMQARAFVGDTLVAEGQLMAQISKNK